MKQNNRTYVSVRGCGDGGYSDGGGDMVMVMVIMVMMVMSEMMAFMIVRWW